MLGNILAASERAGAFSVEQHPITAVDIVLEPDATMIQNAQAANAGLLRGEHYSPHVTIGVGTVDYLNALLAAPFPTFTFSVAGASAYQFGNFGTAAKQLHSFKLT